ncbi:MAG: tRNA pseudouridine(55) synthase TruB [Cellvibrionales bacterium]|nr:tRNA pseudouridine(55) synthase TruB [Cellvibrionales bacterium]
MGRRRKGRPISGILLLDKPTGPTSNQALMTCKRLYQAQKAGHTGSLDPLASGVLPLCFGEATKFSQYLLNADKSYQATLKLGERTDTADSEGEVVECAKVPNLVALDIEQALKQFLGESYQVPPMYSALKQNGKPLYELARQGIEVEREKRAISISSIQLDEWIEETNTLIFTVSCSKGTYIRTLGEDVAEKLGTLGHLTALRRIRVGEFHLENCHRIEAVQQAFDDLGFDGIDQWLISPENAVNHLPMVELDPQEGYYVRLGQPIFLPGNVLDAAFAGQSVEGLVRLRCESQFIGLGEIADDGLVQPKRLIAS